MEEVSPKNAAAIMSNPITLVLSNIQRNQLKHHLASGTAKMDGLTDRLCMLSSLIKFLGIEPEVGLKMSSFKDKQYCLKDIITALQCYVYEVVKERDGFVSIKLRLGEANVDFSEGTFSKLQKECESAILLAVEEHKREQNCEISFCAICHNKEDIKSIMSTKCNDEKKPVAQETLINAIPDSYESDKDDERPSSGEAKSQKEVKEETRYPEQKPAKYIPGEEPSSSNKGKSQVSTSVSKDDEYKKLNIDLEKCHEESRDFYVANKKKIYEERKKDPNLTCIICYKNETDKMWFYKLFKDKESALRWIHHSENRAVLGDHLPYINVGIFKTQTSESDIEITDLKNINVAVVNPTTGEVLAKVIAAIDNAAELATYAYDPGIFRTLIMSTRKINGKRVPIVYARLIIDDKELSEIFEIELENDPEVECAQKLWYALGLQQLQKLPKETRTKVLQKNVDFLNKKCTTR